VKCRALATDYDGTLACDGRVDAITVAALKRARDAGIRLLLVTGRELPSLFNTFADTGVFDLVVAENGAVLYDPSTTHVERLGPAPPPELIEALQRERIPMSVGHSIVASWRPHEVVIGQIIADLELDWDITFNKNAVMMLPSQITKATGLRFALAQLDIPALATVGVGDAENDHAFLRFCGLSVAVSNALPAVKAAAHVVTAGARGAGVREVIDELLSGKLAERASQAGVLSGRVASGGQPDHA
jgi:hydroxymethylpyrimidine pyrophosphatase-like HAD family hydrolase